MEFLRSFGPIRVAKLMLPSNILLPVKLDSPESYIIVFVLIEFFKGDTLRLCPFSPFTGDPFIRKDIPPCKLLSLEFTTT